MPLPCKNAALISMEGSNVNINLKHSLLHVSESFLCKSVSSNPLATNLALMFLFPAVYFYVKIHLMEMHFVLYRELLCKQHFYSSFPVLFVLLFLLIAYCCTYLQITRSLLNHCQCLNH